MTQITVNYAAHVVDDNDDNDDDDDDDDDWDVITGDEVGRYADDARLYINPPKKISITLRVSDPF